MSYMYNKVKTQLVSNYLLNARLLFFSHSQKKVQSSHWFEILTSLVACLINVRLNNNSRLKGKSLLSDDTYHTK